MKKESRVVMSDPQHEVLTLAANKSGMPLSTYLRVCALNDATKQGIRTVYDNQGDWSVVLDAAQQSNSVIDDGDG
tara:strand:+ start:703 stop:927 length:225 start_codon:yes stop_codon:yes gene_type:complete